MKGRVGPWDFVSAKIAGTRYRIKRVFVRSGVPCRLWRSERAVHSGGWMGDVSNRRIATPANAAVGATFHGSAHSRPVEIGSLFVVLGFSWL